MVIWAENQQVAPRNRVILTSHSQGNLYIPHAYNSTASGVVLLEQTNKQASKQTNKQTHKHSSNKHSKHKNRTNTRNEANSSIGSDVKVVDSRPSRGLAKEMARACRNYTVARQATKA